MLNIWRLIIIVLVIFQVSDEKSETDSRTRHFTVGKASTSVHASGEIRANGKLGKRLETQRKTIDMSKELPARVVTRSRREILESSLSGISTRSGKKTNKQTLARLIDAQPMRSRISGGRAYKTASDKSDTVATQGRTSKENKGLPNSDIATNVNKKTLLATSTSRNTRFIGPPELSNKSGNIGSNCSTSTREPNGFFQRAPQTAIQSIDNISRKQSSDSSVPVSRCSSYHAALDLQNRTNITESFVKSVITRWSPKWFDECGMLTKTFSTFKLIETVFNVV